MACSAARATTADVKETPEDFKPRRDGYFEHQARWGEVTVGTLLAQRDSRMGVWEVIGTAHGTGQIKMGDTLWLRIRNVKTGVEHSLAPRSKVGTCVILTNSPLDTVTAPPTEPTDTQAILSIIEGLGATLLADRDNETGMIACPDYVWEGHIDDGQPSPLTRGLLEHMRFAHSMQVGDDYDYESAIRLHGEAHKPTSAVGKGGFTHIHLPEEDILNDWVVNRRAPGIKVYATPQEAS